MRPLSARTPRYAGLSRVSTPGVYVSRSLHPSAKKLARKLEARAAAGDASKMEPPDYKAWSQEKLVERVTQLEQELKNKNPRSAHSFIALQAFAYRRQPVCVRPRARPS